MTLRQLFRSRLLAPIREFIASMFRKPSRRQRSEARMRLWLEALETRLAPTINLTINPAINPTGAVTELINAINTANGEANGDTINLYAGGVYKLETANNNWYGPNGLPAIFNTITIN